jgi:hypothetical protein
MRAQMLNTAMINRQQNKIENIAKRTDSIALSVTELRDKLQKQRVTMSTGLDLSTLFVTGTGEEATPYQFLLDSDAYTSACTQLADLFNNHKGNTFDDVEMDTKFDVGELAYSIKSDKNYIGYFVTGSDSEKDTVDGVDTFKEADFISIDAIPIGNSATEVLGGGQPTISFALAKDGELWTAIQSDVMSDITLIKQDQTGDWYDCFIREGTSSGTNALTSAVHWMPKDAAIENLNITYILNGTNFN